MMLMLFQQHIVCLEQMKILNFGETAMKLRLARPEPLLCLLFALAVPHSPPSTSAQDLLVLTIGFADGVTTLSWPARDGVRLQRTTDVVPAEWEDIAAAEGTNTLRLATSGATGFFRLVQGPTAAPPPSGLIAWWPGDGHADDIIGVNHGTLLGDVTYVPGMVGQAFSLDGGSCVFIGDTLNVGSSDFTIEVWILGDPGMESWGRILDKGYWSGFALGRVGNSNRVGFEWLDSGSQNEFGTVSQVIDGRWHHIALVKARSTAIVYADGVRENSESVRVASQDNSLPLLIGYNPGEGWPLSYWIGQIDELSIYGRALTAKEIGTIYKAGSAGKSKPTP